MTLTPTNLGVFACNMTVSSKSKTNNKKCFPSSIFLALDVLPRVYASHLRNKTGNEIYRVGRYSLPYLYQDVNDPPTLRRICDKLPIY